ncbi:MAG: phenylalanine--tRNA ligase subunit alpha [Anaplasmataceae bacterium]|nr:phenylalanine--tRNA ligase subunit alpha [Anaplasmataceae bacterium]
MEMHQHERDFREILNQINDICELDKLKSFRAIILSKGGFLSSLSNKANTLEKEYKIKLFKKINEFRSAINDALKNRAIILNNIEIDQAMLADVVDLTMPTRETIVGSIHPLSSVILEIKCIMESLGFNIVDGPELDTKHNVFTALNTPEFHPAYQMQDTFHIADNDDYVLRPHTSSVQIRHMQQKNRKPPFWMSSIGKVYRNDNDATHSPMFHQLEALCIDKNINVSNLKFYFTNFLKSILGDNIKLRWRNSFFPFTALSMEIDLFDKQNNRWLEIAGCGMVHPNVLKAVNIDHEEYQGFAWGVGIERLTMIKYKFDDIKCLFNNDIRWLRSFHRNIANTC